MNKYPKLTISTILMLFVLQGAGQSDFLKHSWEQHVKPIEHNFLKFDFTESSNQLGHSFYPWQQTNYQGTGQIWCNSNEFAKQDTLKSGQNTYTSKSVITEKDMLLLNYGDENLFEVTNGMFNDQVFLTARYLPTKALHYFFTNKIPLSKHSDETYAIYQTTINKTIVKLYINKYNSLISKIVTVSDDELFGDVETEYIYSNYVDKGNLYLALNIDIKKINGKLLDQVRLSGIAMVDSAPALLKRPANYTLVNETSPPIEVSTEKYTDNIHLVELKHTDDKILIVEFADFLLVAEAPLNSRNGELIIREAGKIAPNKPVKYFVFGHYHPHYLGGIRAFVHKGARIIASKEDIDYVAYIVNAKHTIRPDSLHIEPQPLYFEVLKDSLTIADNKTEMKIYFIGNKSAHTNDYLIYYFPKEKIVFEDDLVWIPKSGEIKKAGNRQAGLYHAIKNLGIEVETIIQSWPVQERGVKTVIPFKDLEKSVDIQQ